ncbi:MAG: cytochrome P450 [Sphingobacteriales bacterium]|jgi:cytochrome P450
MKKLGLIQILGLIPGLITDPLKAYTGVVKKYGTTVKFKIASEEFFVFTEPEHIKHILKDNQDNYSRGKALVELKDLFGEGLFASEGKHWQHNNRLLKPAFHGKILKDYESKFQKHFIIFCDQIEAKTDREIDLQIELKRLMLSIQMDTQLILTNPDKIDEIISALAFCNHFVSGKEQSLKVLGSAFGLTNKKKQRKFEKAIGVLDKYAYSIINQAIETPQTSGATLSLLLESYKKNELTKRQVRDEIMSLLFAGFDTVAEALFFTLYEIAKSNKVLNNILKEIIPIDGFPLVTDLQNLTYTKAVVQEGLRMYPVAWIFPRIALGHDDVDGNAVRKNAFIVISPFLTHRLPKYWDNPESFSPDRFIEGFKPRHPFAYIPFGQGKRVCIGNALAMMQMRMLIPAIIKNFHLELVSKDSPIMDPLVILTTKKAVLFRMKKRSF